MGLIGIGLQAEMLQTLTVTASQPHSEAADPTFDFLFPNADALAVLPIQKGTYQDLFQAVAGAYGGSVSIGTFSLRGLNQDGLFLHCRNSSQPPHLGHGGWRIALDQNAALPAAGAVGLGARRPDARAAIVQPWPERHGRCIATLHPYSGLFQ